MNVLSEIDWLKSTDPDAMIAFLGERGSSRRWQLFACHCCWRILPLLVDDRSRLAVSVAERLAEGMSMELDFQGVLGEAHEAELRLWTHRDTQHLAYAASAARRALSLPRYCHIQAARATGSGEIQERIMQARLLRDLFGNPFQVVGFDPAWRTDTIRAIAEYVYETENFHELPILGDALEDAGCTETTVLTHCRDEGFHVRGCWVVDAILEKQ